MHFVQDAIDVLKFNKSKMAKIAGDEKATVWAFVILGLPFVVNVLLVAFKTSLFLSLQIKLMLIPLISVFGSIFLMSLVAQAVFHAKGDHMAFFRVMGHAGLVMWLSVIPFILGLVGVSDVFSIFNLINLLAGIWMLAVAYHVLMDYYKLSQQNAIISIVLGVVGAVVLQSVFGRVLIGKYYQFMY